MSDFFNLYYHPIYTAGINKQSKFPRERYQLLYEKLISDRVKYNIQFKNAKMVDKSIINRTHEPEYVDRFLNSKLDKKEIRRIGLKPWNSNIIERTLRIIGGSLTAMEDAISSGGLSGNMAGGTHHAHREFGSGFCIFNDLAICAKVALEDYNLNNILIIDLDVHQGDGTAEILKNEKRAYTVSIHCSSNFPFKKYTSDLDISLESDTDDNQYLNVLADTIDFLEKIPSDLILFQAGVDVLFNDRYGNLKLTRKGLKLRNKMIFEFAKKRENPVCIFMGGGYSEPIDNTVNAFKDLFILASKYHKKYISSYA